MEKTNKATAATKNQNTQNNIGSNIRTNMHAAKARFASQKVSVDEAIKKIKTVVLDWLDKLPDALARGILRGLITAIVLNVITRFFWPELPETIPTIYEFFNGFLVVGEFLYKTALGGIASLFNGTFFEFGRSVMVEIGEMWNMFCSWIGSISF